MIKWMLNSLGATSANVVSLAVPKAVAPPPLPANRSILYRLTDPNGNPAITKQEDVTTQVGPYFQVIGFVGGGYGLDTPQGQAASLYMVIDKAIKNYKIYAEKDFNQWAAISVLTVVPRAGRQLNAYYDRRTLSFFFDKDNTLNKQVYAADSPDIVAHELGHAILDFKRPDFWSVANVEIPAIHEAWGDIFSFASQLQHPEVAQAVLNLTGGNIRTPNVISSLAEQFGKTIYDNFHLAGSSPLWLRNAINNFKYISPQELPVEAPVDQLAGEPHSFSRVLTGACYDLMATIYETEKSNGKEPLVALMDAAKGIGWYVDRTLNRTPNTTQAMFAFAATLLQVDRELSQSFYQQKFLAVLKERQLIANQGVKMLSAQESGIINVRLRDVMPPTLSALDYNPLYNVEVQIPNEGIPSVVAAKQFLDYLHKHNKVSPNPDTPFDILGGKLVRSHFESGCYFQNWLNPTQPEYYKPPKPWNHFCPCGCREQLERGEEKPTERRVIREKKTRAQVIS